MAAKKTTKKEPSPTPQYSAGDRVRVSYRGIEHVGTIQSAELRRGAIAYEIAWTAESLARDPALRGMRRVTDGDVLGLSNEPPAPTRELRDEGFAQRMAARRT